PQGLLLDQPSERPAAEVDDGCCLAPLDLPSRRPQPVGEVGILGGADLLPEAANSFERLAAARDVGALGIAPRAEAERPLLAHHAAKVDVSRDHGGAGGARLVDHTAADQ